MNAKANTKKLIVAKGDAPETLGSIVLWDLSGTVRMKELKADWTKEKLRDEWLIEPTTPAVALSRACRELQNRHRFVRKVHLGYVIVDEKTHGQGLRFSVALKATLDESNTVVFSPEDHEAIPEFLEAYDKHLGIVVGTDVGRWLGVLARLCDATPVRDNGGVHFVPFHGLAIWRRAIEVIQNNSDCVVHDIPAMHCASAIEAILAGIIQESERESAATMKEINEGSLSARALGTRQVRALHVANKVQRYEDLLGVSLEGIKGNLRKLNATVTAACFAALAKEGEEA